METTINTNQTNKQAKEIAKSNPSLFWEKVEFSRFGIISMLIIIIGCVGGFAASFGADGDILKLALIAFPTIISLAFVLAVAPMRVILYSSIIAIILDLIVLVF